MSEFEKPIHASMEPRKLNRAVIKEELVALCAGDYKKAIVLNQLIYWSERVRDFDAFITEENKNRLNQNLQEISKLNGWIYKTAEQLSQETMMGIHKSNMRRLLEELIGMGFISKRRNDKVKWDKTFQYRVELGLIQANLEKMGFWLDGYGVAKRNSAVLKRDSKELRNATPTHIKRNSYTRDLTETTTESKSDSKTDSARQVEKALSGATPRTQKDVSDFISGKSSELTTAMGKRFYERIRIHLGGENAAPT